MKILNLKEVWERMKVYSTLIIIIEPNNPFIFKNNISDYWIEEEKKNNQKIEKLMSKHSIQKSKNSEKSPPIDIPKDPVLNQYELPIDDDEEDIEFPKYMKENNPFENSSGFKRPRSSKYSERYSKC